MATLSSKKYVAISTAAIMVSSSMGSSMTALP
jgi:hypothetical protein